MNYLKYTAYVYIIFAIYFVYDGISKFNIPEANPWLSFGIAGLAVFMFFFRTKYSKKFAERSKKS